MNRLAAILAILFCSAGCKFIPLYELEGNVVLDIDYQLEQQVYVREGFDPDNVAAFNEKVHGKMPEDIQVLFYEAETHEIVVNRFMEATGGVLEVPTGRYDVLVYSLGTAVTRVEGSARSSVLAATEMTTRYYEIGSSMKVITEPDHLYTARFENIAVGPVVDDIHTVTYLDTTAFSILDTWTFEMIDVEGMEYISNCEAFISTQEGREFLWGSREGNQPGSVKISIRPDFQTGRLYSIFNTFGRYMNYGQKVKAVLLVTNNGGDEYLFEFDVTDQYDDPDNVGHNIVVSEKLTIPKGQGGGGFEPVVDPWWDPEIITN